LRGIRDKVPFEAGGMPVGKDVELSAQGEALEVMVEEEIEDEQAEGNMNVGLAVFVRYHHAPLFLHFSRG
jgi:hypothetical protein